MEFVGGDLLKSVASRVVSGLIVDPFHLWPVRVDGVEVTQAIQYYKAGKHLSDAADRGPDNSVRLVANKPAWVRVYVRSGLWPQVTGVTGTLLVERRKLGLVWEPLATLPPQPPGNVTAYSFDFYLFERGNVASTLNFVVPADQFAGVLRLTVTLTDRDGHRYDSKMLAVDATLRQTLRLRGIFVSYDGPSTANSMPGQPPPPNLTLARPTLADLQATAGMALRTMPVSSMGVFTSAGTQTWSLPLDDPRLGPGECSSNWEQLRLVLNYRKMVDGNRTDVVYYGLLPIGIPLNVPGCGSPGLGSGESGDQQVLLHEIGHGYGFQHTPCDSLATPTRPIRRTSRTGRPRSASTGWTCPMAASCRPGQPRTTCPTASLHGCRSTSIGG
jgi:hypothetical protein